ncbi:MAG TPA: DUF1223 domain-containing protein [Methylibium sp.]|nr:DUF1223 domain-containing protein [Methylibium sp.]
MPLPCPTLRRLALAGLLAGSAAAAAPPSCAARSIATAPLVIELYTSEGCSSCPPADRWLSTLTRRAEVFPLAFHVDYWDRLGWTDRFARPAWTRRQYANAARNAGGGVYTPQVLVNGRDHRRWPSLPAADAAATVGVELARDGPDYVARVVRRPGAPPRLAAYWAVTEDGHVSQVRSGENQGATLHHDAVVRELLAVATVGDAPLAFTPGSGPDAVSGPKPRQVLFVVTDAATGTPLQAVRLGC